MLHIVSMQSEIYSFARKQLHMVDPELRLRMFFHYKPTYFHLHVHVVHVNHPTIKVEYLLQCVDVFYGLSKIETGKFA